MSVHVRPSQRGLLAMAIALLAALFFTMTYVLNRIAATDGGYWAWTATLRYLLTLPLLLPLMPWQGGIAPVLRAIRTHPWAWFRYSVISFVLFYLPLTYAAASGPSWLIAGSFQFTVIAGMLCAPFLYSDDRKRLPLAGVVVAIVIITGVMLMQLGYSSGRLGAAGWFALACVLVAAVAYPLGNRLLLLHLEKTGESLNASQRVFGLTLSSQPVWWLVAAFAWNVAGSPPWSQVGLAAGVALLAGVVATILFFQATGMVRDNPTALGATEAMQAAELLFATLIGVWWLKEAWPRGMALVGAGLVMLGIVAFAWIVARQPAGDTQKRRELRSDRSA